MGDISRKGKVFVIGSSKTGTTSMGAALDTLGFKVGDQEQAEGFIEDWGRRDFGRIVDYCKSAEAFQDVPFSWPDTYRAMDEAFPDAKFILTVRENAEEWFESLKRFHTAIVGKGRLPTAEDLKAFPYREEGWLWRCVELVFGGDEDKLYDRENFLRHYEMHRRSVLEYFRDRPEDLLVLNVSDAMAMERLCDFLGVEAGGRTMPHLNRSRE